MAAEQEGVDQSAASLISEARIQVPNDVEYEVDDVVKVETSNGPLLYVGSHKTFCVGEAAAPFRGVLWVGDEATVEEATVIAGYRSALLADHPSLTYAQGRSSSFLSFFFFRPAYPHQFEPLLL